MCTTWWWLLSLFFITIGFLYRVSTHLFFIAFSYIFLLEQAHYLNHLYLVILISFILCMVPANRYLAVDARLNPDKRSDTVPAWSIWLLRAQFEVVYIYAGIVKLNADWLQLEPLSMWLARRSDMPIFGHLFLQDWSVAVAAYGIIILHILGAPLLLWRRARIYIFLIYACFHTLNHFVFSIGIFPWLTLFATLIFFDPDWPKQVWRKLSAFFWQKDNAGSGRNQHRLDEKQYLAARTRSAKPYYRGYRTVVCLPGAYAVTPSTLPRQCELDRGRSCFFLADEIARETG